MTAAFAGEQEKRGEIRPYRLLYVTVMSKSGIRVEYLFSLAKERT